MTATPMTAGMAAQPELMAKFRDRIPLGRVGTGSRVTFARHEPSFCGVSRRTV